MSTSNIANPQDIEFITYLEELTSDEANKLQLLNNDFTKDSSAIVELDKYE